MHNFNLTTIPTASQSVTNLSILEESCNSNSYSYWVSAGDLYDDGSTVFSGFNTGTSTVPSHWLLRNGGSSGVGFYIKRHNDWKYGSFDIRPHWSSTVANGIVKMLVKVDTFTQGSAATAGSSVAQLFTVGSANVINTTLMQNSATRIDSLTDRSKIGLYFHLQRDGSAILDTNTGDVGIYGIELIYNEVKRVIGDAIKK
jgi:hypothetical protein